MEIFELAKGVLSQLCKTELSPALLHQLSSVNIGSVEATASGGFANLETDSVQAVIGENGAEDFAHVWTLVDSSEVGDAILHFRGGRIAYLEIWLYDPQMRIEQLSDVSVF